MTTQGNTSKIQEIWKDINGYEGIYQVSNLGKVKSLDRLNPRGSRLLGKVLRHKHRKDGYLEVGLCKNGKVKYYQIHRLVALAFVRGFKKGLVVNHIDENKENNNSTNLEWVSQLNNLRYGTRIKRMADNHKKAVYAVSPSDKITKFSSQVEASKELNIRYSYISAVVNKRRKTTKGYRFYGESTEIDTK